MGFDSFETLLAPLLQGEKNPCKVHWLTEFTPVHPLTQTFSAKAQPGQLYDLFCVASFDMAFDVFCRPKRAGHHVLHMYLGLSFTE